LRLPETVRCRSQPARGVLSQPETAVPKGNIFVVLGFETRFSVRPARSLIRGNKDGKKLKTEDTRTWNYHLSFCKTVVLELFMTGNLKVLKCVIVNGRTFVSCC
jgi:hypothetical protein